MGIIQKENKKKKLKKKKIVKKYIINLRKIQILNQNLLSQRITLLLDIMIYSKYLYYIKIIKNISYVEENINI